MKTKLTFLFIILFSMETFGQWKLTSGPFHGATYLYKSGTDIFTITWSGIYMSADNGNSWTAKNTGLNDSTNIRLLVIGNNKIFAGTAGGIYLTTNNGNNWTDVNNGLTQTDVRSLVIKGDTLYAGIYGSGIFSSANNGSNWTIVNADTNFNVSKFVVNGNDIYANASGGVYISNDNCASWTKKDNGIPYPSITALAISGDTLFAGNSSDGGYWSTDKGENWTRFIAVDSPEMTSYTINGNNIYACTANWIGNRGGIYLTTNYGNDWTTLYTGTTMINTIIVGNNIFAGTMNEGVIMSAGTGKNWKGLNTGLPYNAKVKTLTRNGNDIYAGTTYGVYKTSDVGNIWEVSGLAPDTISALACSGNNIFAAFGGKCCNQTGAWGGLSNYMYMSQDNGETWQRTSGLIMNVLSLVTSGTNIFAVAAGGVRLSKNNGKNWTSVNTGLPSKTNIYTLAVNNTNIFAGTANGVYLTTNEGNSWTPVNVGIPLNTNIYTICKSGSQIFAGGDGVFLSEDNGNSWMAINYGLPPDVEVHSLASIGSYIFAIEKGSVYLSTNKGSSWSKVKKGLPLNAIVNCIVLDNNYAFAGTETGTYKQLLSEFPTLSVSTNQLNLVDSANSETSFNIYSNIEWTIKNNSSWLTPSIESGVDSTFITLRALANLTDSPRTDTVTVSGVDMTPQRIIVTQTAGTSSVKSGIPNINITLFPLPVVNNLNISYPNLQTQTNITIYSLDGIEIYSSEIANSNTYVDMSSFPSGFYLVKINSSEKGIVIKKIVKQ